MSPSLLLAAAAGGALGSVLRFAATSLSARLLGHGFPYGTIFVNVLGSLAMGMLIEALARHFSISQEVRVFLITGVLGGFTTFSAFSLDVVTLIERGAVGPAVAYVLATVAIGILALFTGLYLVRLLWP